MADKPKIALWFRYGPAEHAELFHAIPEIVAELARTCEVHYFGLQSRKPLPPLIRDHAVVHALPWRVDRTSTRDKWVKTALWLLALPWVGRRCRRLGIRAVYIDETVPLTAPLARRFFGPNVAFSVVDFFPEIYFGAAPLLRPLVWLLRHADLAAWRRLPVIFTRANSTRTWLGEQGVDTARVHPVYDPCDFSVYHPVDKCEARRRMGYGDDEIVLVHHGILHPNKGNDRILRALATLKQPYPHLRYLLVGAGPEYDALTRLARQLGIEDRVQMTGWLPEMQDVNLALNAGDIGLVMRVGMKADDFHATGALVHNMACGLPILCARLGGTSEIVREGVEGLLFDPNDMAEFGDQLGKLIRSSDRRRDMGAAALARARDLFDMQRVTRATCAPLLAMVTGEPRPGLS